VRGGRTVLAVPPATSSSFPLILCRGLPHIHAHTSLRLVAIKWGNEAINYIRLFCTDGLLKLRVTFPKISFDSRPSPKVCVNNDFTHLCSDLKYWKQTSYVTFQNKCFLWKRDIRNWKCSIVIKLISFILVGYFVATPFESGGTVFFLILQYWNVEFSSNSGIIRNCCNHHHPTIIVIVKLDLLFNVWESSDITYVCIYILIKYWNDLRTQQSIFWC
jgi:hypothetical protein